MMHKVVSVHSHNQIRSGCGCRFPWFALLAVHILVFFARAGLVCIEFCSGAGWVHLRRLAYCAFNALSAALVDVGCILMCLCAVHWL